MRQHRQRINMLSGKLPYSVSLKPHLRKCIVDDSVEWLTAVRTTSHSIFPSRPLRVGRTGYSVKIGISGRGCLRIRDSQGAIQYRWMSADFCGGYANDTAVENSSSCQLMNILTGLCCLLWIHATWNPSASTFYCIVSADHIFHFHRLSHT